MDDIIEQEFHLNLHMTVVVTILMPFTAYYSETFLLHEEQTQCLHYT